MSARVVRTLFGYGFLHEVGELPDIMSRLEYHHNAVFVLARRQALNL